MVNIYENKGLSTYKLLLDTFLAYADKFPMTSAAKYIDQIVDTGKKCIPTDERAQAILQYVLTLGSAPEAVQSLLNRTFGDLPIAIRPMYVTDGAQSMAKWKVSDKISDRICDLLAYEGSANGEWVDCEGKKVNLIDTDVMTETKEK